MQPCDPTPNSGPSPARTSAHLTRLLMLWTGALAVLIIAGMRSLPPTLVGLLLPYRALVTWHLLSPGGPRHERPQPSPVGPAGDSWECPVPQVGGCVSPEALFEGTVSSNTGDPSLVTVGISASPPVEPKEVRGRRRARPTHSQEPAPASWIQVAPGRFIRGEEPEPSPDAAHDVPKDDATRDEPSGEEPTLQVRQEIGTREHEAGGSPDDLPEGFTKIGDGDGAATDRKTADRHDEPQVISDREDVTRDQPEDGETVRRQPACWVASGT